ncbi:MAG: FHA domain-containing protein [Coriobacteriia bacterium]|nr:FHA domain-containing protein [Coriobacteriia bacterium]
MTPNGDLSELLSRAREELADATQDLAAAQLRLQNAQARVRLLEELLALEMGTPAAEVSARKAPARHGEFIDATASILESRGAAMSIDELRSALLEQGVPLPGKGLPANLISRFQRSDGRIVRVGRGLYDIDRGQPRGLLEFADGRQVALQRVTRVGKGDQCELLISDSDAAEVHALVTTHGGTAIVGPVGESAQVFVNDSALAHPVRLSDGDRIRLGSTVMTYRDAVLASEK